MRCACPAGIAESIYNMVAPTVYLRSTRRPSSGCCRRWRRASAIAASIRPRRRFLTRLSPEGRAALLAGWPSHHFRLELDQSLLLVLEDQSRWAIKRA
jgi:NitT/TauT family transport system substrate-binding protein